jgi:FAD/FMN-containing dehydrogenase
MISGPDADFVPRDLKDKPALGVIVFYTGSEEAGRKAFAPILSLGHVGDTVEEQSYADFQCASDDPPGYRIYGSADYLGSFPDAAVDAYCAAATEMVIPSPSAQVLFPGGGQMARETADWPLPWRSAPWCFHPWGMWPTADDDERGRGWVKNSRERMKPWSTGATYLNFIGNEGDDRVVAGLGRENYARLAAIKAKYDPDNIFHINQNIRPEKA